MLAVDARGCIDAARFLGQQFARVEVALTPIDAAAGEVNVVEATSRFAAQGGAWKPSPAFELAIDDVALGRRKCRRLWGARGVQTVGLRDAARGFSHRGIQ